MAGDLDLEVVEDVDVREPPQAASPKLSGREVWAEAVRRRPRRRSALSTAREAARHHHAFSDGDDPLGELQTTLELRHEFLAEVVAREAVASMLAGWGRIQRGDLERVLFARLQKIAKEPIGTAELRKICEEAVADADEECAAEQVQACYTAAMSALFDQAAAISASAPMPHSRKEAPVRPLGGILPGMPAQVPSRPARSSVSVTSLDRRGKAPSLGVEVLRSFMGTAVSSLAIGGSAYLVVYFVSSGLHSRHTTTSGLVSSRNLPQRVAVALSMGFAVLRWFSLATSFAQCYSVPKATYSLCLGRTGVLMVGFTFLLLIVGVVLHAVPWILLIVNAIGVVLLCWVLEYSFLMAARSDRERHSAIQARASLAGKLPKDLLPITCKVFFDCLPMLLAVAAVSIYSYSVVYILTRASAAGRIVAFSVAFLVKLLGRDVLARWSAPDSISVNSAALDLVIFAFDFVAGLTSKLLALSLPDVTVSFACTAAASVLLCFSRLLQLLAHTVAGNDRGSRSEQEWIAYARRGEVLIAGSQNSQVVEFSSMAGAVSILLHFCAGDMHCTGDATGMAPQQLWTVVALQLAFAVAVDTVGTVAEASAGLSCFNRQFWTEQLSWWVLVTKVLEALNLLALVLVALLGLAAGPE